MNSRHLARIGKIAKKQQGAASYDQLRDAGLSKSDIHRALQAEWLQRPLPRVYSLSTFPQSWERLVMETVLYAGPTAVVSHRAAARLHELDGVLCSFSELTVRSRKKINTPILIQHERNLPEDLVTRVGSFRVTTVAATVVDMAAFLDPNSLSDLLDHVLCKRRCNLRSVASAVEAIGVRAQRIQPLRAELQQLQNRSFHESKLEAKTARLIKKAGYPTPLRQFEVKLGQARYRLDLAYPAAMVAVECDGYAYHGEKQAFRRDVHKWNRLTLAGWRVLRVTWNDLRDPLVWLRQLEQLLSTEAYNPAERRNQRRDPVPAEPIIR